MKVLGGRFKGSPVRVKSPVPVRPTAGKVREWIFHFLEPSLAHSRFLDLFAGSGIMGIEALSRGSLYAAFVDIGTGRLIRANLRSLPAELHWRIHREDAVHFLSRRHPPSLTFHIVYADPPYMYDQFPRLFDAVAESPLLEEGGYFVLEYGRHSTVPPAEYPLPLVREKRFGETLVALFRKGNA